MDPPTDLPFNHLTIGMIRPAKARGAGRPKMKLQAAEGRYFLPILFRVLEHFLPVESNHERKRLNCMKALQRAYEELNKWTEGGAANAPSSRRSANI